MGQSCQKKRITLFKVPLGYRGATGLLMTEAIRHLRWPDYSGVIYLAPTPAKIRDAQRKFHRKVQSPYIPPRFFTLKQLARYIFDREVPGRYLPPVLQPIVISELSGHSMGYARILSDFLKELKQHHPFKGVEQIRSELTGIFSRLGIPDDASLKLNASLDIFGRYQSALSSLNYYDDDDILNYSCTAAERLLDNFSILLADGFYDITDSEKNLIEALVRKADTSIFSSPVEAESVPSSNGMEGDEKRSDYISDLKELFAVDEIPLTGIPSKELSYVRYNSIEDEIEGVARHIKNLFVIGRLKSEDSVIMTFPGMSDYREITERVFRRYGLPYTISAQKPALRKPPLRDAVYLLESVAEDFPRSKFTAVLSSPFFRNIPELIRKKIPSLSLRSGIIKGKASWENFGIGIEDKDLARTVGHGLSSIMQRLEGLFHMKDASDVTLLSSRINLAFTELGFDAGAEVSDELLKAMEMVSLIPQLTGLRTLTLGRFTDFLKHVLGSVEYQVEAEGIQVMDFFETRGLEPAYLYFCGLKDGDMPSKPPVDHILPDSARKEYGLVHFMKHLSVQKLNFLRITASSSEIHLSYPSVEGDKLFLPSSYLPWSKELPEHIFGIFSQEELQVRRGSRPLSDSISEIVLEGKTRDGLLTKELAMPMSVTNIDAFRRCPRRFFVEKILNLTAAEIAEYEIEAKVLGTLMHRIMEELLKDPLDDLEKVRGRTVTIIDSITAGYPVDTYWKNLLKESFLEILPRIFELEADLRAEGFFPFELEMKVKEEVLPSIVLKGKIDRIDSSNGLFRIIDYKTGAVTIGSEIIKKGRDLQLPLYAAMLRKRGMEIEKAGIYSMKEIGIKWLPTKKDRNTLDDYISISLRYLEESIQMIREGRFPALPIDEFLCSNCEEAPYCPYVQGKGLKVQ